MSFKATRRARRGHRRSSKGSTPSATDSFASVRSVIPTSPASIFCQWRQCIEPRSATSSSDSVCAVRSSRTFAARRRLSRFSCWTQRDTTRESRGGAYFAPRQVWRDLALRQTWRGQQSYNALRFDRNQRFRRSEQATDVATLPIVPGRGERSADWGCTVPHRRISFLLSFASVALPCCAYRTHVEQELVGALARVVEHRSLITSRRRPRPQKEPPRPN